LTSRRSGYRGPGQSIGLIVGTAVEQTHRPGMIHGVRPTGNDEGSDDIAGKIGGRADLLFPPQKIKTELGEWLAFERGREPFGLGPYRGQCRAL